MYNVHFDALGLGTYFAIISVGKNASIFTTDPSQDVIPDLAAVWF